MQANTTNAYLFQLIENDVIIRIAIFFIVPTPYNVAINPFFNDKLNIIEDRSKY